MDDFRSTAEIITDRLRSEILTGAIAEGHPLREIQLTERFKVSRGPVRDALLVLSQEGLLESHRNRGARVACAWPPQTRTFLLQTRVGIESIAVESICAKNGATVEKLDRSCQLLRLGCENGDLPAVVHYDMGFHRLLMRCSGHENLEKVWLSIMGGMRLTYSRHGKLIEVYEEHLAILEAIRKGNFEQALEALKVHIH